MLNTRFIVNHEIDPPSFLPPDVDITGMMDVTRPGDRYRRYMAVDGTIHDGNEYFKQYYEQERAKGNVK